MNTTYAKTAAMADESLLVISGLFRKQTGMELEIHQLKLTSKLICGAAALQRSHR